MNKPQWSLAELRRKYKPALTQRELSARLNIPASTIGMWETGKRVPGLHKARLIAEFFGVSTDNICFGPVQRAAGDKHGQASDE